MSDPIPSASADHEGLENPPPANAEDRKAAAALSSLHTNEIGATASPTRGPSNADQEALGKAMSRLEIASGQGMGRKQPGETLNNGVEVKKKAIKISPADVTFLVDQLDLSKSKATELLKASEGDITLALRAFLSPSF
ncbi:uncharacterized protein N7484_011503 [Penicillium longicatenatum]|uniref:uncharacterized protein n=1 Tax=Penicillium longicatenatum TaxID=1561947 RepID=UPI002546E7E1|nr:uncharacterized protein N7484_011503 [Penicillium longicatenatum]KAJ5631403.1 hypothetical protein N7484_011503 [Penicillium longicatenatum]